MPLYAYRCTKCGYLFEKIQHFSATPESECPKCHGVLERPITAPALSFKGAGWYVNDYPHKSSASTSDSGSESKSESKKDDPASESKSDSNSETKSETKSSESTPSAPAAAPAAPPSTPSGSST